MQPLHVHQFTCRSDNFGLLLHDPSSGQTASIDSPDGETIATELAAKRWKLTHIFNTHHHYDHVPGNEFLKQMSGCTIVGARHDAHRIPGIDVQLDDGETHRFGDRDVVMIATPGHTLGSVCYHLPLERLLFTGDTLFSMGCGRLFEGSPEQMWRSLQKLRALPDDTQIYCGHEYTMTNCEFALELEPDNAALRTRESEVRALRRKRLATLPVSMAVEKATNPFLRPDSRPLQEKLGLAGHDLPEVFAALRERRNEF